LAGADETVMTTVADTQVLQTLSLLSQLEITLPSWDLYVSETSTWAAQKNRKPRVWLNPFNVNPVNRGPSLIEYLPRVFTLLHSQRCVRAAWQRYA